VCSALSMSSSRRIVSYRFRLTATPAGALASQTMANAATTVCARHYACIRHYISLWAALLAIQRWGEYMLVMSGFVDWSATWDTCANALTGFPYVAGKAVAFAFV
jgi:hypothetical protein